MCAAARKAAEQTAKLKWYSLYRPFDRIVPLRERVGALETVVMRLANIVGRADGELHDKEAGVIRSIRDELHHHLRPMPIDEPNEHTRARRRQQPGDRDDAERCEQTFTRRRRPNAGPLSQAAKQAQRDEAVPPARDAYRRWKKRSRSSTS